MKITVPNRVQFLAMFLLALFSLVIVPKELWHNCDHHAHYHHCEEALSANGTMENGDDCGICDFQLLPFAHSAEAFDLVKAEDFHSPSFRLINTPLQGSRFTLPGRGPPRLSGVVILSG